MSGTCVRCGQLGRVELDHPTGRHLGRPLHPGLVVPLCPPCHRLRGRLDRAAGAEGGVPGPRLVLARLAAWSACFAMVGRPITLPPAFWSALAAALEGLVRELADLSQGAVR